MVNAKMKLSKELEQQLKKRVDYGGDGRLLAQQ